MTHVVSHLNDLLHRQQSLDVQAGHGFDLWAWLTGGNWWTILGKILIPVASIMSIMLIILCCIIPCVRRVISSMIDSSFTMVHVTGNYYPDDSSDSDESDL